MFKHYSLLNGKLEFDIGILYNPKLIKFVHLENCFLTDGKIEHKINCDNYNKRYIIGDKKFTWKQLNKIIEKNNDNDNVPKVWIKCINDEKSYHYSNIDSALESWGSISKNIKLRYNQYEFEKFSEPFILIESGILIIYINNINNKIMTDYGIYENPNFYNIKCSTDFNIELNQFNMIDKLIKKYNNHIFKLDSHYFIYNGVEIYYGCDDKEENIVLKLTECIEKMENNKPPIIDTNINSQLIKVSFNVIIRCLEYIEKELQKKGNIK